MRTIYIDEDGDIKQVPLDIGRHLIAVGAAKPAPEPEPEKPAEVAPDPEAAEAKPARKRGARDEGSAAASS